MKGNILSNVKFYVHAEARPIHPCLKQQFPPVVKVCLLSRLMKPQQSPGVKFKAANLDLEKSLLSKVLLNRRKLSLLKELPFQGNFMIIACQVYLVHVVT
jgi:hypothetical protein